jgi:hypothetical protein
MTSANIANYKNATKCYVCNDEFTPENYRVRDHCHYTGTSRGAARTKCNLTMKQPKFIPVLFHNLEGYDSHLFEKNLGVSEDNIKCIPKTEEKYISFSKETIVGEYEGKDRKTRPVKRELRFLDSLKFTISSLDKLTKNLGKDDLNLTTSHYTEKQRELLKRKGVFPYEYTDGFNKLEETSLPSKDKFYSRLNNEGISDADYERAPNVWIHRGIKFIEEPWLAKNIKLNTDLRTKGTTDFEKNFFKLN